MQTDLGRLSQINSEIETLIMILINVKSPPMASIIRQIDNFKWRIGNIFEIDINAESIIKTLDDLINKKKNIVNNKKFIVEVLDDMHTFFKKIIASETMRVLKNIGYYPPPSDYLPHRNPNIKGGCDNPNSPFCPSNRRGGNIASKAYQYAANTYRKLACSNKARPLMDGELHPKCWNFCGPGTRIDLKEVQDTPPYDNIDAVCRDHDLDYYAAKGKPDQPQLIRKADKKMLNSLEKYKNDSGYSLAKSAISGKVKAEDTLKDLIGSI
jgi:hypothetical protein